METLGDYEPSPELLLDRSDGPGGVRNLSVDGEIDLVTGDRFKQTVMRLLDEPGVTRLQLDVAGLRFVDSNGVTALVKAHRYAEERGVTFGIVGAGEVIRDLLEMLGVYDMLALDRRSGLAS
jgi:anti-anti-sigma factor